MPFTELDLLPAVRGGEASRLLDLLNGEVHADHPTGRTHQAGRVEHVHPRPTARVHHDLARLEVREVEVVADARERLHGLGRHPGEPVDVIVEVCRHLAPELEVKPAVGVERDVAVHLPDLRFELPRVDRGGHRVVRRLSPTNARAAPITNSSVSR